MKPFVPYLRVLAGLFAATGTWLAVVDFVNGNIGDAFLSLLLAAGFWYLAVGWPIRDHFARKKAEQAALAARAQAGHEAFLAGDPVAVFGAPPPPPERRPVRRGVVVAGAVAAIIVLAGVIGDIGDGLDDESDSTTTTTTSAPTTAAAAAPLAPAPRATAPEQTAVPGPAAVPEAASAPASEPSVMPYVTCMNLQDAQDTIQETGVFYSRSRDATGAGRSQIVDRNWVVVGQTPPAGSLFAEGDAVLSVVKIGEPGDCS